MAIANDILQITKSIKQQIELLYPTNIIQDTKANDIIDVDKDKIIKTPEWLKEEFSIEEIQTVQKYTHAIPYFTRMHQPSSGKEGFVNISNIDSSKDKIIKTKEQSEDEEYNRIFHPMDIQPVYAAMFQAVNGKNGFKIIKPL